MRSVLKHKIHIKAKNDKLPFVVLQRYQRLRRNWLSYATNMLTGDSSGKLVTLYRTAGHHITKHCNFYKPRCRFQNEDNRESNIRICAVTMKWRLTNYIFFSMAWEPQVSQVSPTQRPQHDDTQHSQETNIHAPGGVRPLNPSKRAATDDQLHTNLGFVGPCIFTHSNESTN